MHSRWDLGDSVRVIRNVRNDGTYCGAATGDLLIRRGSVGAVVDIGTFLQDQIIYSVHFIDDDRIVGCREEELADAAEPWIPSIFESREWVRARRVLSLGSALCVPRGALGQVLRVVREDDAALYHVHFDCLPGRTLAVPEAALMSLAEPFDA
ncbi:MAG: nitrogen fixation protein NifZ [Proteobacteria bacterium]|nr:nitrogen fixation protein NifZ [Pseudomonadota bacterium]